MCWPSPTHSSDADGLFPLSPWRAAREIIDWSIPSQSIFHRKKPLCAATLRRIEHGIERYWGNVAEPFLIMLRGTSNSRSLGEPLPTITAGGGHLGLVEPFVGTIDNQSSAGGTSTLDSPLSTIVTKARHCLVEPLILHQMSPGRTRPVSEPVPTITTSGAHALIVPYYGGTDCAVSVDAPLPTVTCRDTFALVEGTPCRLDIRLRMFQPHELAAATGFPDGYRFCGTNTEQVRQIGNAVPPLLAQALAAAGMEG